MLAAVTFGGAAPAATQDAPRHDQPATLEQLQEAARQQPSSAQAHLSLGIALRKASRLDEAMTELKVALKLHSSSGEALFEIGLTRLEQPDIVAAEAAFTKGLDKRFKPRSLFLYGMGLAKIAADSLTAASVWLTKAVMEAPDSASYHKTLGDVYARQLVTELAVSEYQLALERGAASPEVHYAIGKLYFSDRNWAEALKAWQAAVAADSSYAPAYADLINLYLIASPPRYEEAVPLLMRAAGFEPENAEYQVELGRAMARTPAFRAESLPYLEKGAPLAPQDSEIHALIGGLRLERQEYAQALSAYQQALGTDPGNMEALRGLAEAQKAVGDTASAIATLKAIAASDTAGTSGVEGALGILLYEQGRYDEAIPNLWEKIRANPRPILFRLLGMSYIRKGDFAGFAAQVRPALDSAATAYPDRDFGVEYSNLGTELFRAKRYDEARAMFAKRLESDPSNWSACLNLGLIQFERKAYADALESLHKAAQLKPDNAQVYFVQGLCHHQTKAAPQARSAFARAAELDPKHVDAHKMAGLYLLLEAQDLQKEAKHAESQKRASRAAGYLQEAVELAPRSAENRVLLAQAYVLSKQVEKGVEEFERVLKLDPANKDAQDGIKRLKGGP
jgi:tetratricopeptide (TPR) repeat protein